MALQTNTFLQNGNYKIIKELGQGGFGITYLAEQVKMHREVCVKEFLMSGSDSTSDGETVLETSATILGTASDALKQQFVKEAQTIAALKHPNIVNIFDVFEENGTAYYVMEYLSGGSLEQLVKKNGPLAEKKASTYMLEIANALKFAHEHNVMHFDVKPANILLNEQDEAILIDFGLAKHYDVNGDATSLLANGFSEGYAPIEQYSNDSIGEFAPRIDVYSLGATFYKILSGKTPPTPFDIIDQGLPELDSSISIRVREAISKAMTISRKKRPASMEEFISLFHDTASDNIFSKNLESDSSASNKKKIEDLYNKEEYDTLVPLLEKMVLSGDDVAMYYLGLCYRYGNGVVRDLEKAHELFLKAADEANADAMQSLGEIYSDCDYDNIDSDKADEWYKSANDCYTILAAQGDADAMDMLCYNCLNGTGVPQNLEKAEEWCLQAVEFGSTDSVHYLAGLYEVGDGVPQNLEKAVELYRIGAEAGNPESMTRLAYFYEDGYGVRQDYDKANRWYLKAAAFNDVEAMWYLAENFKNGYGFPQDYQKAIELYLKAAEAGDSDAMYNLANIYANGLGVPQDYQKAIELYLKAAEAGNFEAMYNLGSMYEEGLGVPQNIEQSYAWRLKADIKTGEIECSEDEFENSDQMYNLAYNYENGNGVPQDYVKASMCYLRSAELGNAAAMNNLGVKYFNGSGIEQNFKRANEWYQRAAELGNAIAMNNLGMNYYNGKGVPQDYQKANEWYQKAAEAGNFSAMYNLGINYFNGTAAALGRDKALDLLNKAAQGGIKAAVDFLSKNSSTSSSTSRSDSESLSYKLGAFLRKASDHIERASKEFKDAYDAASRGEEYHKD